MKSIIFLFLLSSGIARSQSGIPDKGILFDTTLSWNEIKAKAKKEGKFIFLDCYATWCGPCKSMENLVYPLSVVGDFVNSNFISVKIQMDRTQDDNKVTKSRYGTSASIQREFNVSTLPAYLFFDPNGKIVHRGRGFKKSGEFLDMVKSALDSTRQLYSLLTKYKRGYCMFNDLPRIAEMAKEAGEDLRCSEILTDYFNNYPEEFSREYFLTRANIDLVVKNASYFNSRSKAFQTLSENKNSIDSVMQVRGFGKRLEKSIISLYEIKRFVDSCKQNGSLPDWDKLCHSLSVYCGDQMAKEVVLDAKVKWYKEIKDWFSYIECLVIQFDNMDSLDPKTKNFFFLNSFSWDIFTYSNNVNYLKKAVTISEKSLGLTPPNLQGAVLDTKANLLYKLGHTEEAIRLETKAVGMNPAHKPVLERMIRGEPTWPSQFAIK